MGSSWRWVASAALLAGGLGGCSDDKKQAADTAVVDTTATDSVGAEATVAETSVAETSVDETSEVVAEKWAAEIGAVTQSLDDATAFFASLADTTTLGDDTLSALAAFVPKPLALGDTPDEQGFIADAASSTQAFQDLVANKPRVAILQLSFAGGDDANGTAFAATLTTTAGALIARRLEGTEAGEAFDLPRPVQLGALKSLSWSTAVPAGDEDAFEVALFYKGSDTPAVQLTVAGRAPVTIPINPAQPVIAFDGPTGVAGSVGILTRTQGPCRTRQLRLHGKAYQDANGQVWGVFGGVAYEFTALAGYARGVIGLDSDGQQKLLFRVRTHDGAHLDGYASGPFNKRFHGDLLGADGKAAGVFAGRFSPSRTSGDDPTTFPFDLSLSVSTECTEVQP